MAGVCGESTIEDNVGAGIVAEVDPLMPPTLAVMVALPSPTLDANPASLASLLIVATLVESELQSTEDKT